MVGRGNLAVKSWRRLDRVSARNIARRFEAGEHSAQVIRRHSARCERGGRGERKTRGRREEGEMGAPGAGGRGEERGKSGVRGGRSFREDAARGARLAN
ncbi:hypothetical protein KM043_007351 [Ampulex compressa]|nr:hypothetical protein KM043_007351 [Ampulex compressa]